jgi:DNA polymerase-3 subunit alpha
MGMPILSPDINRSGLMFEPEESEGKMGIRYGLAAIKNVGEGAMQEAVAERTRGGAYRSLQDFCSRVDTKRVNRKAVESLIRCGAFDWTGTERAQLFAEVDEAMAAAASAGRDRAAGQVSLFDAFDSAPAKPAARRGPAVTPWTMEEKLAAEKELLGFYVTGHPLDRYRPLFEKGQFTSIAQIADRVEQTLEPGERNPTVQIAGALVMVEKKFAKKSGKPFAMVVLEDFTDSMEVRVFGQAYAQAAAHLETGKIVSITARVELRGEEPPALTAMEVKPLKAPAPSVSPVHLDLAWDTVVEADLVLIRDALLSSPGKRPVVLHIARGDGKRFRLLPAESFRVEWTSVLARRLARWARA